MSDLDGDLLELSSVTAGNLGHLTYTNQGLSQDSWELVYTPNSNENGTDSVTLTISDGHGGEVTKAIDISIIPVNDSPIINFISPIRKKIINLKTINYEKLQINLHSSRT